MTLRNRACGGKKVKEIASHPRNCALSISLRKGPRATSIDPTHPPSKEKHDHTSTFRDRILCSSFLVDQRYFSAPTLRSRCLQISLLILEQSGHSLNCYKTKERNIRFGSTAMKYRSLPSCCLWGVTRTRSNELIYRFFPSTAF